MGDLGALAFAQGSFCPSTLQSDGRLVHGDIQQEPVGFCREVEPLGAGDDDADLTAEPSRADAKETSARAVRPNDSTARIISIDGPDS